VGTSCFWPRLVSLASTKVGTNLSYRIGDGTVMF
jgi:hypothetical protein